MRKIAASLAFLLVLNTALPALAGGYGYGYGYRQGNHFKGYGGHRRHGYRYGFHGHGGALVGVLLGGVLLGHLLSQPAPYVPPAPALGGCRPTTGTAYLNGRLAQYGGTMCYDRFGAPYVIPGSEYFIGYLR